MTHTPIRLGMVGGGKGAMIGNVHRIAARLDNRFALIAGALSTTPERNAESAAEMDRARQAFARGDFAEAEPSSLSGNVHLSDDDGNCFGNTTVHAPIAGVVVRLLDALVAQGSENPRGAKLWAGYVVEVAAARMALLRDEDDQHSSTAACGCPVGPA